MGQYPTCAGRNVWALDLNPVSLARYHRDGRSSGQSRGLGAGDIRGFSDDSLRGGDLAVVRWGKTFQRYSWGGSLG